nr:YerC/YecD family TrpR-related protein [Desulfitobacterium dichloroeliminans]
MMKEHEDDVFQGIDQRLRDSLTDALFDAILLLKDREECYRFFQDIATVAEIKSLAQRLEVAKLLEKNVTYTTIAQATGASTATISRVKRCLFFGADGYQMVLKRLAEQEEGEK